jgi:hypothetical protein
MHAARIVFLVAFLFLAPVCMAQDGAEAERPTALLISSQTMYGMQVAIDRYRRIVDRARGQCPLDPGRSPLRAAAKVTALVERSSLRTTLGRLSRYESTVPLEVRRPRTAGRFSQVLSLQRRARSHSSLCPASGHLSSSALALWKVRQAQITHAHWTIPALAPSAIPT